MKIKKFPQSCILVETNNVKILIDPSTIKYDEKFLKDWEKADAVLITHKHNDHINADILSKFKMPIYSTNEVKLSYPNVNIKVIKQGDEFTINNLKIKVVKALHGYISQEGEILENVGYILDDGKIKLYVTSDTIRYNGIEQNKCDAIMVDTTAFDASMNLWGTTQTFKDVGAKTLIIAHQDAGKMMYDKKQMENYLVEQNINFIIPNIEENFEI